MYMGNITSTHKPDKRSVIPYIVQNKPFSDAINNNNNNNIDHITDKKSIDDTVDNMLLRDMLLRETNETCNVCEMINKCC